MLAPQLISLVTGYFARLSSDCDKAVTDGFGRKARIYGPEMPKRLT